MLEDIGIAIGFFLTGWIFGRGNNTRELSTIFKEAVQGSGKKESINLGCDSLEGEPDAFPNYHL